MTLTLNLRAASHCERIVERAQQLRIKVRHVGAIRVIDMGIEMPGGLEAGRLLAEACMGGLGEVQFVPGDSEVAPGPAVMVRTDHPVAACMASQYAGWEVKGDDFFAMGSGPMRAAAAKELLFDEIGYREETDVAVGVLEAGTFPPESICRDLADACGVPHHRLTLLLAPTNSHAGNVQVVARSVETAMHKLHELGFDLSQIDSAWGVAPLPPVASDPLTGIGRTNDAVLYGAQVVLYVRGDDALLAQLGPKVPSTSSSDHGRPFKEIFAAYDHDFYQIDKQLFSPAVVELVNLDSGRSHRFGKFAPKLLKKSFGR